MIRTPWHHTRAMMCLCCLVSVLPLGSESLAPRLKTPGYGISNHFQLMPDKVKSNNAARLSVESARMMGIKTLRLSGNRLEIEFDSNVKTAPGKLDFTLLSPNGCVVERVNTSRVVGNAVAVGLRKRVSPGVYLVKVSGDRYSASRMVMAWR